MKKAHSFKAIAIAALACLVTAICQAAPPKAGDIPPSYVGKTLEGKEIALTDYPGKAVVVSFWATWCAYCLKELPILHNIQKAVGPERIQVIAVNIEERATFRRVTQALEPLKIQLAYDPDERSRQSFGVNGIPHMVIIGKDGKIDSVFHGYSADAINDIVTSINRAIGAGQPPSEQAK